MKNKSTARDALDNVGNADASHKVAVANRKARSVGDAHVIVRSVNREDHLFILGKHFNVEYFWGDHPARGVELSMFYLSARHRA